MTTSQFSKHLATYLLLFVVIFVVIFVIVYTVRTGDEIDDRDEQCHQFCTWMGDEYIGANGFGCVCEQTNPVRSWHHIFERCRSERHETECEQLCTWLGHDYIGQNDYGCVCRTEERSTPSTSSYNVYDWCESYEAGPTYLHEYEPWN